MKREKEEEVQLRHISKVIIIASSHRRFFEVQMAYLIHLKTLHFSRFLGPVSLLLSKLTSAR